ncbi:MAG TPA: GNAT family N-acetyltransferase, partial [Phenylobacterium sp.]|nr:GNAT family N-acetyltransferase [Phenylobacterium sp.]
ADRAVGLPPLDDVLARDMIEQTRVARLLHGFRDRPPADLAAVSDVLVRLSRIAGELPDLQELDINPLLADHAGVIALDVRVGLTPEAAPASPCAISPYPDDLVQQVRLDRGLLTIRPIRPQDAPSLIAMVGASTPEDVRLRFGTSVKRMPYAWAARLSQIDYDREMAFVAEAGDGTIEGVSRLAADPEGESAEFALMVRSDAQNQGLGRLLLEYLLRHAQSRGLRRVWGDVGRDNAQMLDLLRASGFGLEDCEDAARVKAVRVLAAGPPAA